MYVMLGEGQRNDINYAIPVLEHIDIEGSNVLADRGYDSNQLLDYIYERGGEPTIPSRNLNGIAIGGSIKKDTWLKNIFSSSRAFAE